MECGPLGIENDYIGKSLTKITIFTALCYP
jgi:hypothetical protein